MSVEIFYLVNIILVPKYYLIFFFLKKKKVIEISLKMQPKYIRSIQEKCLSRRKKNKKIIKTNHQMC